MADITVPTTLRVPRGTIVTLRDGASNTLRMRVRQGTLTLTEGGHNIVRAKDENGENIGPARKGAQAGESTVAVDLQLFALGGDATDPAAVDYLTQNVGAGTALANWTSSDGNTDFDHGFFTMDWDIALPVVGGSGATYSLSDCVPQPGTGFTNPAEGLNLTGTLESPDARWTITKTT